MTRATRAPFRGRKVKLLPGILTLLSMDD